jgi:bifunctional non-homologous end joining protein LigD
MPPADTKLDVNIEGRRLRLSNLRKVLYPSAGFTKQQVLDYYIRIWPVIAPHVSSRPLTLKRYPEGSGGEFFYEKQCPNHAPDWLTTVDVWSRHNERHIRFCIIDSLPSLVWVANLASLELHTSLSLAGDVDTPTMMVFDLDPGAPAGLVECADVALALREMLHHLGLESFAKSSGGKGLHIYVPLNTPCSYDDTKETSRVIAELMRRQMPQRVVTNMRRDLRAGKVLVDWSQNDQHKTTVCVYSLRARPRPTVSLPLSWQEVQSAAESRDASGLVLEAPAALERVDQLGDLFAPVLKLRQKLPGLRI